MKILNEEIIMLTEFVKECYDVGREAGCEYVVIFYNDDGEEEYGTYLVDKEEMVSYVDGLDPTTADLYDLMGEEPVHIPFLTKNQFKIEKLIKMGFEVVDVEKVMVIYPGWPQIVFDMSDKEECQWMHHIIQTVFDYQEQK